ncbi:MAG: hypothetical protein EXS08_15405 [Planctomycetes bacterium]|nr:hypothetical protein [Planctomycetota bacterium]
MSTTDDVLPTAGVAFPVKDGDLVTVEAGRPVAPFFAGGHFQATWGFAPGDIDAFAHFPGSRPGGAASLAFSLLSNEAGFLDGDVLTLTVTGGALRVISEADLASAMGAAGANIDIDALAYDSQGRLLFSLTDNLSASSIGPVLDGDILRLEPSFAGFTRLFTEAEVQTAFTAATGLSDPILDVQALESSGSELWYAVQSPSRHDGSVLALGGTPRVVFDENTMGLGGAEVDALGELRPGDEIPVFHMSLDQALPGDVVHVEARGKPQGVLLVLMAGRTGTLDFARFAGFGSWYLDRFDPWLSVLLSTRSMPLVVLDGAGRFAADWHMPTGSEFGAGITGELGWSFQVFDVAHLQLSAPFRVLKL